MRAKFPKTWKNAMFNKIFEISYLYMETLLERSPTVEGKWCSNILHN